MKLNAIQSAMYSLIQRYVQRQSLVLEAMRDLRPDLIMRAENKSNSEFWTKWTRESWQAFVLDYARRSATGEWGENKEWEYFLHGIGCRLTHKVTHERIEWDLGPLHRFDRFWFVNHLECLLDQPNEDEVISAVREWYKCELKLTREYKPSYGRLHDAVFSILEQLCQKGLLSQHQQYYTLVSQAQPPNSLDH